MKTFLGEVASNLYDKFGENISDINVVFPNKRARLFFEKELKDLIDKPIWQPNYETIDNFVKTHSGIELAHNLKLIAVLYEVYKDVTGEEIEFDKFYSFGEVLLGDFDTIDKYLVNSTKLFQNIADIGEIDDIFDVNSEEREVIESFWSNYNKAKGEHVGKFSKTWKHLNEIYKRFNRELDDLKIGYSGRIYRSAVRELKGAKLDDMPVFAFVGFNALNSCEKTIFKHLQNNEKALFYWDCDRYYLNNIEQEAGLFLRRNVALFGEGEIEPTRMFRSPKNIEVIKTPSEVTQAKVLYDYLEKGDFEQTETAIILTNENLLPVVISFIPENVTSLNITMGGAINHSVPYVFFERIVRAQKRRKEGMYHLDDLVSICSHPLIKPLQLISKERIKELKDQGVIYTKCDDIQELVREQIFTQKNIDGKNIGQYLRDCISSFCFIDEIDNFNTTLNNEYAQELLNSIDRINNIVAQNEIEVSITIYLNLLSQIIRRARVAYLGEPLNGAQMMGILESRCIDFKNVIIMSVTDETFPSSKTINSFIPYNLRKGFGLPNQSEHAAVWAYYFYRLIQRAENVILMYAATSETSGVSEPSRYIYQLEYESGHEIKHINAELIVNKQESQELVIEPKNSDVFDRLNQMRFSPSRINDYIDCKLKFFYKHIKNIRTEKDNQQIDASDTGNILHKALQIIYDPLKHNVLSQLRSVAQADIQNAIETACQNVIGSRNQSSIIENSIDAIKELVSRQIRTIIDYDINEGVLSEVVGTEIGLEYKFIANNRELAIYGSADRVDRLNDGTKRIVDYKSGKDKQVFDNIESLFESYSTRNKAALQTLIYAIMFGGNAAIYNVKQMGEDGFSPLLKCKETKEVIDINTNGDVLIEVRQRLEMLFDEIFSDAPFYQCGDLNICSYCEFSPICKRD